MSDDSAVRQLELGQAFLYIGYSAHTLYLFEICITFSQEVEVIWERQWSATSWIYVFTRYSTVLLAFLNFMPIWNLVDCKATQYLSDGLQLIQCLCFACFSALRIYALLDGKRVIAGVVFMLNLVPFVTNLYHTATSIILPDVEVVCVVIASERFALRLGLSLATRICVILGDVFVLLVTWSKTAIAYRETRRLGIKAPLVTLLFRDGTLYFVILLSINVFHAIEGNIPTLFTLQLSGALLMVLTPIIICRFVLNLRQVKFLDGPSVPESRSTTLRFVGNAGESLQFGEDEEDSYDIVAWGRPNIVGCMAREGFTR